MLVQWVQECT